MGMTPLKLGVNIDHVATLRQARGVDYPDLLEAARACERAGAHGITIHLREDRRHIQDADVTRLREHLSVPMNLEMANVPQIMDMAVATRPAEVCLVPEKRQELTTEGGLDVAGQRDALRDPIARLVEAGIRVSLFIDPAPSQIAAAAELGAAVIELHTGTYCNEPAGATREACLSDLIEGARLGHQAGLVVNAGHGLNLENIAGLLRVPYMDTLNIGHSIVARSVLVGLEGATAEMLEAMAAYAEGEGA